jgi:hypothetical protein
MAIIGMSFAILEPAAKVQHLFNKNQPLCVSMTFCIMTLSIMTLSIMTFSIMTFSTMVLSIMTLIIIDFIVTLSISTKYLYAE